MAGSRWTASPPLGDCLQSPAGQRCERTIRPIALKRKNALFAPSRDYGHAKTLPGNGPRCRCRELGNQRRVGRTCKLNAIEPHAYLTVTLQAIVNGHKQSQINALLPWNYARKV